MERGRLKKKNIKRGYKGDEDKKTNRNNVGTRQGTMGGRICVCGWRAYFSLTPLPGMVNVTCPERHPTAVNVLLMSSVGVWGKAI